MSRQFSRGARRALRMARDEARWYRQEYVRPEHLVLGLIKLSDMKSGKYIRDLNLPLPQIKAEIKKQLRRGAAVEYEGKWPHLSGLSRVIHCANDEAQELHDRKIHPVHLLLGLFHLYEFNMDDHDRRAAEPFVNRGISMMTVYRPWQAKKDSNKKALSEDMDKLLNQLLSSESVTPHLDTLKARGFSADLIRWQVMRVVGDAIYNEEIIARDLRET